MQQKAATRCLTPTHAMHLIDCWKATEDRLLAPLQWNIDNKDFFHDDNMDHHSEGELQYDENDVDSREGFFFILS